MADTKDPTDLSAKDLAAAQTDAAKEVAKDSAKVQIMQDTGTTSDAEPVGTKYFGSDEIQMFAHLLDDGIENLKKAIDPKDGIPEEKVAGLLILERNGKNRTEFVKLLMKRLGIKDLRAELPQAGGPDYTNDTTNLTAL